VNRPAVFGGTAEGRAIAEFCANIGIGALYFTASEQGALQVEGFSRILALPGRLDSLQMARALESFNPSLAIDATHPYASAASLNIANACKQVGLRLMRVRRESVSWPGGERFASMDEALAWLESTPGAIFATTGASASAALSRLTGFKERVWLRLLPGIESLEVCLGLGYSPSRLIMMAGPFSEELNRAMFSHASASILLTKESGEIGGFPEKMRAAASLGMKAAIISRPEGSHLSEESSLEEVFGALKALSRN
jgi:precorrin-6x reductase